MWRQELSMTWSTARNCYIQVMNGNNGKQWKQMHHIATYEICWDFNQMYWHWWQFGSAIWHCALQVKLHIAGVFSSWSGGGRRKRMTKRQLVAAGVPASWKQWKWFHFDAPCSTHGTGSHSWARDFDPETMWANQVCWEHLWKTVRRLSSTSVLISCIVHQSLIMQDWSQVLRTFRLLVPFRKTKSGPNALYQHHAAASVQNDTGIWSNLLSSFVGKTERFESSGRGIPELLIQREDMLQKIKATLRIRLWMNSTWTT